MVTSRKKREKNSFFGNLLPNKRISFGPAWSVGAGLISNNPPAAPQISHHRVIGRFIANLPTQIPPVPLNLAKALRLNGLLRARLMC